MSQLKFFTDEHIVRAIVVQLRQQNIDVLRCEDVGMKNTDDELLLEYATEHGYALLSMDADVTRIHNQWLSRGKSHGGIFYAPMVEFQVQQGIGSIVRDCIQWAELIEGGAGTLSEDIHSQLWYIEK